MGSHHSLDEFPQSLCLKTYAQGMQPSAQHEKALVRSEMMKLQQAMFEVANADHQNEQSGRVLLNVQEGNPRFICIIHVLGVLNTSLREWGERGKMIIKYRLLMTFSAKFVNSSQKTLLNEQFTQKWKFAENQSPPGHPRCR